MAQRTNRTIVGRDDGDSFKVVLAWREPERQIEASVTNTKELEFFGRSMYSAKKAFMRFSDGREWAHKEDDAELAGGMVWVAMRDLFDEVCDSDNPEQVFISRYAVGNATLF